MFVYKSAQQLKKKGRVAKKVKGKQHISKKAQSISLLMPTHPLRSRKAQKGKA